MCVFLQLSRNLWNFLVTCSWNGQFVYRRLHFRPLNSTQHSYLLSRHYKYIVICLMRFTFDQLSTWQNAYLLSCLWTKSCARCDSGMSCTPRGTCLIQVSCELQVARVWRYGMRCRAAGWSRLCHISMLCIAGGACVKVWDALAGGRLVTSLSHHHKTITSLAFSSNHQRILSGALDR